MLTLLRRCCVVQFVTAADAAMPLMLWLRHADAIMRLRHARADAAAITFDISAAAMLFSPVGRLLLMLTCQSAAR